MSRLTAKQVTKAIGDEHLSLVDGNGYWYFIYDDPARNVFDTRSIYTMRLSNMTLEQWVSAGQEFISHLKREWSL